MEPGRDPPRRVRRRATRARPAERAGRGAVRADPADARGGGPQPRVRADHEGADRRLRAAQLGRRAAVLRDDRPVRPERGLHRGAWMGSRGRGRLVAGRLDDPRAGHPQPRRELRAARVHEQRPVLDPRRRLGARHPPDERLGPGPGRVRRRVLARRQADGARLEHRQLGLPPVRRSRRHVLAPRRRSNCRCARVR